MKYTLFLLFFMVSCGTINLGNNEADTKLLWYQVITAYEARLDTCIPEDQRDLAEPVADVSMDSCVVSKNEANNTVGAMEAYIAASELYGLNPSSNACEMAKQIAKLLPYTGIATPTTELFCDSTPSELDLLLAQSEAKKEITRE